MTEPTLNIHGKPMASCDNCDEVRVLHRGEAAGMETSQCAECIGEEMCQRCSDIAGACDCDDEVTR